MAHKLFDPFWKMRVVTREKAYRFMVELLGIPKEECHIGMMDDERCRKLIEKLKGKE